nr:hypothetical protein [Nitrospira sp.]
SASMIGAIFMKLGRAPAMISMRFTQHLICAVIQSYYSRDGSHSERSEQPYSISGSEDVIAG